MNTKDIKLPVGKIFIYALINMSKLVLVAMTIMSIVILFLLFIIDGKEGVVKYMNKEVFTLLSYIPLIPFIFTLTHFPQLLSEYSSIRKIITKSDYILVKVEYERFHIRKEQINYTLKMDSNRDIDVFTLLSEDGKVNITVERLGKLKELLFKLNSHKTSAL